MRIFRLKHPSLSGLIALALSASLGLGVAIASESDSSQSIKTVLKLKTGDGSSETLRFDGALAVGEARGYETDGGTPVLVTRTEEGLKIELAERTIHVALPEADAAGEHGITANVEKMVRIEGDSDTPNETRVVVLRGDHAAVSESELEQMLDGETDAVGEAHAGDGKQVRRVHIVRKQAEGNAGQD